MRVGYFHGGRVFLLYRSYVFGEFSRVGLDVDFYTYDPSDKGKLILVPSAARDMQALITKRPFLGRITGREIVDEIMKGRLDGGAIGESSFIEAVNKKMPLVAVAALGHDKLEMPGKAILVRKGANIKKPADFIGKTIISRDAGPGDAVFLREFFEKIGVNPEDVKIIDYKSPVVLKEDLSAGRVDGGYYHMMAAKEFIEEGLADLYQPMNWVNPELSQAVLVFRRDYYESHKPEIKKFLKAYLNRIKYEKENDREWYLGSDGVREIGLRAHMEFMGMDMPKFDYPPLINAELLNQMQALLLKHKQIGEMVPLYPYVDQSLLNELMASEEKRRS